MLLLFAFAFVCQLLIVRSHLRGYNLIAVSCALHTARASDCTCVSAHTIGSKMLSDAQVLALDSDCATGRRYSGKSSLTHSLSVSLCLSAPASRWLVVRSSWVQLCAIDGRTANCADFLFFYCCSLEKLVNIIQFLVPQTAKPTRARTGAQVSKGKLWTLEAAASER